MSNIFLIGATGGVGSRLSPKLVEAGHSRAHQRLGGAERTAAYSW